MHVASTTLFEGPAPAHEEFRDHIALAPAPGAALPPEAPLRPLRPGPAGLGRRPPPQPRLPRAPDRARRRPGSEEQLRNLAARVFSQQLDRSKPLWELWLVEGLEGGRFAIVGKSHHALVDGVSGMDITTVLFDSAREPADAARGRPGVAAAARAERRASCSARRCSSGPPARRRSPAGCAPRCAGRARSPARRAAPSPTPARCSAPACRRLPRRSTSRSGRTGASPGSRADLDEFKRIKNDHGGTVNDVVLSVVAGALGNYLRARGHDTSELEMRAMVPVSVRAEAEHGALGNRVSGDDGPAAGLVRGPGRAPAS